MGDSSEKEETDSKSYVEDNREMSEGKKALLEKQKKFEFGEVAGKELREKEERSNLRMQKILKFALGCAVVLLLVGLYFFLLR